LNTDIGTAAARVQKSVESVEENMLYLNEAEDECGYGKTPAT
jgi:hypothetical protein